MRTVSLLLAAPLALALFTGCSAEAGDDDLTFEDEQAENEPLGESSSEIELRRPAPPCIAITSVAKRAVNRKHVDGNPRRTEIKVTNRCAITHIVELEFDRGGTPCRPLEPGQTVMFTSVGFVDPRRVLSCVYIPSAPRP